uniref:NADH dehydrogenase [ubiquinone] 1 alpha subcomplex subunit 1 n=1 Tax=Bionectria ochroleuca TaxID=29856 RepID=A0A8H7TRW2_BIOOC
MPIPFETLLPYGIMIVMFGATGTGLAALKTWHNEGKNPRYSLDQWDRYGLPLKRSNRLIVHELIVITVQQRDRRLTGSITGQVAQAVAPPGFELNNPWKLEKRYS